MADVQADRLNTAARFAAAHGAVVALKGYRTVVAAPDGRLYLNTTGGPHMASGGMGDVLTGMVGGLISQGLSAIDAARLACSPMAWPPTWPPPTWARPACWLRTSWSGSPDSGAASWLDRPNPW